MYISIILLDNNKYKCLLYVYLIFYNTYLQLSYYLSLDLSNCLVIIIYTDFFIHFRYHNFLALGS